MDCCPRPVDNKLARKRVAQPEKWKKNVAKVERYSSKCALVRPLCNHKKNFECRSLTLQDIKAFHDGFYKSKEKSKQDAFILKHCTAKPIKRRRPTSHKHKPKSMQVSYYVRSLSLKKRMPVCQAFFLKVLQIKKYRVQSVMKTYYNSGTLLEENRGGDHVSHKNIQKKLTVMQFIQKLNCNEPHYCRSNTKRYYLPAELSINKLWRMYNAQTEPDLKVKNSYFRIVFTRNFNLGFGTPRTDVCSVCLQHDVKMKTEKDASIRNDLIIKQRVHKLKAKAFFDFAKENSPNLLTLSFDCQKNLCLPKTPDQSAYYSRQINLFNFTIVQGSSKSKLEPSNVFAYCWAENMFPKASNEIASAIYHRLQNTDFTGIKTLHLIADGCAGQNKNTTVLGMVSKWLTEAPQHVKSVEIIFPIVGHSFIPPDRVFAQIEKDIRKKEIIANPDEYYDIIKEHATVISVGNDCKVFDWKTATAEVFKPVGRWHFQFKKCKRFKLKRSNRTNNNILIKGNINYKLDAGVFKNVNHPKMLASNINPIEIPPINRVNSAKAKDVKRLLTNHYGNDWDAIEFLNFFVPLVSGQPDIQNGNQEDCEENGGEEQMCEPQEPIMDLVI